MSHDVTTGASLAGAKSNFLRYSCATLESLSLMPWVRFMTRSRRLVLSSNTSVPYRLETCRRARHQHVQLDLGTRARTHVGELARSLGAESPLREGVRAPSQRDAPRVREPPVEGERHARSQ